MDIATEMEMYQEYVVMMTSREICVDNELCPECEGLSTIFLDDDSFFFCPFCNETGKHQPNSSAFGIYFH